MADQPTETNASTEVTDANTVQPGSEAVSGAEGSTPNAPVSDEAPTNEGQPPASEEGEPEIEFVKDEEGNEFIPRKAFEARLAKLTAQKHDAASQVLEAIKSDPETRGQVLEALGIDPEVLSAPAKTGPQEPTVFEDFLSKNVAPEQHAFHKQYADSVFQTMLPHFEKMLEERMKPVLSHIGKQEVNSFASKHPDYNKYAGKIRELIMSGRAKTPEDAYRIVTWDDKVRGAGAAALKTEKTRQTTLASTPIRKTGGIPGKTTVKPTSLRDAFEKTAKELGMA